MSRTRLIAVVVLVLAAPILFVKLLWFIPTINALQNTIAELPIDGTSSYVEGRSNRLQRGIFSLSLYSVAFIAVIGLIGIAIDVVRRRSFLLSIWFSVIAVLVGLVIFELPAIGNDTDNTYLVIFVYLPTFLALITACAFAISMKKHLE